MYADPAARQTVVATQEGTSRPNFSSTSAVEPMPTPTGLGKLAGLRDLNIKKLVHDYRQADKIKSAIRAGMQNDNLEAVVDEHLRKGISLEDIFSAFGEIPPMTRTAISSAAMRSPLFKAHLQPEWNGPGRAEYRRTAARCAVQGIKAQDDQNIERLEIYLVDADPNDLLDLIAANPYIPKIRSLVLGNERVDPHLKVSAGPSGAQVTAVEIASRPKDFDALRALRKTKAFDLDKVGDPDARNFYLQEDSKEA